MTKVLFVIPTLIGGGSERVFLNLLEEISRDKFYVNLIVILKTKNHPSLPPNTNVIYLNKRKTWHGLFFIYSYIKRNKPEVVFSTLGHLNLLISLIIPFFKKRIRFVARESNTLSVHNKFEKYPKLFEFLTNTTYKKFSMIIAQSQYMKKDMIYNYKIKPDKIFQIYNPVKSFYVRNKSTEFDPFDCSFFNIVFVGRLSKQKRVEDAILIMDDLPPNFKLHIIGDGEESEKIKELINDLNLKDKISLYGFLENPYPFISRANCLISTSIYEGLPNVVIEAITLGTPVVCYDCPGGTSEIVVEGKNGFLIENGNRKELMKGIMKCSQTNFDRGFIMKDAFNRFDVSNIIPKYEKCLELR